MRERERKRQRERLPQWLRCKASACNVGDTVSIPGLGRSPREGNGNPLQYSCLENPMDRGAWLSTVRGVAKSRKRLSDFTFTSLAWEHRGRPIDFPGENKVWEDFSEKVALQLGSEAWMWFQQVHKPFLGREETTGGPGRCKNSRQVWGGRAARCDHTGLHQMIYGEWGGKKGSFERKLGAKDTPFLSAT